MRPCFWRIPGYNWKLWLKLGLIINCGNGHQMFQRTIKPFTVHLLLCNAGEQIKKRYFMIQRSCEPILASSAFYLSAVNGPSLPVWKHSAAFFMFLSYLLWQKRGCSRHVSHPGTTTPHHIPPQPCKSCGCSMWLQTSARQICCFEGPMTCTWLINFNCQFLVTWMRAQT